VARNRYTLSRPRIAYEVRGRWRRRRRPWLLLVQGLGFDRTGWGPGLDGLQRSFRLILVDNRGSGRSQPGAGSFGVREMAADLVRVLSHARVDKAHVLGVSLGGMIAQELAIEYPDRVDALVLGCTTPGWPFAYPMPAGSVALIAATGRLPADVAVQRHVENALSPKTVSGHPQLVEELIAHHRSRRTDPDVWYAQMTAGARYAGELRQSRIRARTLILHGTADRVVDPRNAELLAGRIPNARLVMLPDLGHLFFWEDPQTFVDVVTEFVLGARDDPHWTEESGGAPAGRARLTAEPRPNEE
jgi:3-oxoadipate enol-lactonase